MLLVVLAFFCTSSCLALLALGIKITGAFFILKLPLLLLGTKSLFSQVAWPSGGVVSITEAVYWNSAERFSAPVSLSFSILRCVFGITLWPVGKSIKPTELVLVDCNFSTVTCWISFGLLFIQAAIPKFRGWLGILPDTRFIWMLASWQPSSSSLPTD